MLNYMTTAENEIAAAPAGIILSAGGERRQSAGHGERFLCAYVVYRSVLV